ncbi:uncharacterized protein LOC120109889 isoform X2 [Phoenix dactylifera]|uniref:Uncharacterized protein LOC120109889 isoform X2 n=1 Tax=Phoenix dactylifera TaxID=42345 RepID=A0A8B9A1B1_PHODC|nr:uncharacterized protein LOC120109889 isoform X2 [Phoenix dactylifera]
MLETISVEVLKAMTRTRGGGAHQGITKFAEGARAFRVVFLKIMKKNLPNDPLGPILLTHRKLIAEKLTEEEVEHKVKGEAKKEKHLVSKAQNSQKGLNPSKSKDAKVLAKQRNKLSCQNYKSQQHKLLTALHHSTLQGGEKALILRSV